MFQSMDKWSFVSFEAKAEWPSEVSTTAEIETDDPERRRSSNSIAAITRTELLLDPDGFSNWERLTRVTRYCLRLINNSRNKKKDPTKVTKGELKPEECEAAESYWIREAQNCSSSRNLSWKGWNCVKCSFEDKERRAQKINPEVLCTSRS